MPSSASLSARPARSQALDDLIMGTNSSSIVSKRSVERLYYPNEPHYFRYFVKKPQRRSPLINRGYWMRLKAIDVVVKQFLSRPSPNKKVVVNLGCGSDVLPWQCHVRYGSACEKALFVDVDYPDLMQKKRAVVLGTPQLRNLLGDDTSEGQSDSDPILLRSSRYCQLACDLRELETLRNSLESVVSLSAADVLFVAEVSVTYMDTHSADSLIRWASSIGNAEFCLLEQILPNGPDHPFAKTMLNHFEKLNTPLKSVRKYPTIDSQRTRFQSRGWQRVDTWDLWDAWSGNDFLTSHDRSSLDDIEPFDEWEELMLFGRHYFVMHAQANYSYSDGPTPTRREPPSRRTAQVDVRPTPQEAAKPTKRRFGNAMVASSPEGQRYGVHMMGLGVDSRADTYDLYAFDRSTTPYKLPLHGPLPRMCSTLTDLGDYGVLLAGGRGSPSKPQADCWLLEKGSGPIWRRTWDLPVPLFRHCSVRLAESSLALVVGGKLGPSRVSESSFVFRPKQGWLTCEVRGDVPAPTFGAALCNLTGSNLVPGKFEGLLCGGMREDGTMNMQAYMWELDMTGSLPSITFSRAVTEASSDEIPSVFGAEVVELDRYIAICGGMGEQPSHQGQTVTLLSASCGVLKVIGTASPSNVSGEWPFMIGSSVLSNGMSLAVLGGGATCFSMGTYWETKPYLLELPSFSSGAIYLELGDHRPSACKYLESPKIVGKARDEDGTDTTQAKASITRIPRVRLNSRGDFESILGQGKPVIIEGLDLGVCTHRWTPEYMAERVGKDKEVVVHECRRDTEKMDFNSKNFKYATDSFSSVMTRIQAGGRLYLRSLSDAKPTEAPANIDQDYTALAQDIVLPGELQFVRDNLFSSILRISGRVNMWLHYDVMANVYTQIRGSKRMILFPPSDVTHLSFTPGASSSSLDVFSSLDTPALARTRPHEAILEPGDVLLLPAMWLHTATPMSDMSVAVNVFFRDLKEGYAAGRDVYGNRDLAAYEKGRQDAARISKSFEKLPKEIRRFYLGRIADELRQAAEDG